MVIKDTISGFRKIILLLVIAGAVTVSLSPVSADIAIQARGDQSYYYGEEVGLSGQNSESDFTYFFISGPGIAESGGRLTSPQQSVVSGNPDTFDRVATKPDKTWEYTFYTSNLGLNPGSYTIYAVSQPETKDRVNSVKSDTVMIILKKPFISTQISPSFVPKGQPFAITGIAEGDPSEIQLWIIGDNYFFSTKVPVTANATYTFNTGTQVPGNLPTGTYYLIAEHGMQNNIFEFVVSGDRVKHVLFSSGTGSAGGSVDLFGISGAGSLLGRDAKEALIAAFENSSTSDDTYSEIVFDVSDSGISAPETRPGSAEPLTPEPRPAPLVYAPVGALALLMGIVAWRRGTA